MIKLLSFSEPVTAMTISLTGSSLLVGTEGGLVHSYDVASHQLLRTMSSHKGGAITFLRSILRPIDLVGHVSLNLHVNGATDAKDAIPVRPVLPFQRTKDAKLRSTHEVTIMLPAARSVSNSGASMSRDLIMFRMQSQNLTYSQQELLKDYASVIRDRKKEWEGALASASADVRRLEATVAKFEEQLGKAKAINERMWQFLVQRSTENSEQLDVGDEQQPKRKRGRA